MKPLQWKTEYSVGNNALDVEHQEIISLFNQLFEARKSREYVLQIFQELDALARTHFIHEEILMTEANFPNRAEHKLEHDNFIIWLKTVKDSFLEEEDVSHLAESVAKFLNEWHIKHILTVDMEYKNQI